MSCRTSGALCARWPTNPGVGFSGWLAGLLNRRAALARHASDAAAKRHTSARCRFAGAASAPASTCASSPALTPAPSSSSASTALRDRLRPEPSAASISSGAATRVGRWKTSTTRRCCASLKQLSRVSALLTHGAAARTRWEGGCGCLSAQSPKKSWPARRAAGATAFASERKSAPPTFGVASRRSQGPRLRRRSSDSIVLVKSRCQAGTTVSRR